MFMDNGVEWLPHTGAQPVRLPPLPPSSTPSSSKPRTWTKIGKWLKGPETVMDIDVDPDELEAYTKRWELKWHYFQEAFPETDQDDVDGMGRDEIRARGTLLEREFSRIAEQIHDLQEHTTDYEIIAGSIFTINLMQESQPELVRLLVSVL
ncbi:hypothetical protein C8J57DRAFT_1333853, partial [Mycena rebaudengoi]